MATTHYAVEMPSGTFHTTNTAKADALSRKNRRVTAVTVSGGNEGQ